jgi:radical SAM superfamily enzyme YgiQ (UPF0313 family)
MPLKVLLVQVADIDKIYDVFFRVSGLPLLSEDPEAKTKFINVFKYASKPIHAPYPLGILSLAAYAREKLGKKVEFRIIDMLVSRYSLGDLMREIDQMSPDVVGLSAFSVFSGAMHALASKIKARDKNCKVISGGAYCSASVLRAAADTNVDCIVYGEGEDTFVEILKRILKKRPLTQIPGTAHMDGKEVIINKPRPLIENLDTLPFPAFDLIDIEQHWGSLSPLGEAGPWMILFNSRGCPYHCIYCHRIFGKKTRFMSAKRTLDEILFYRKKYGIGEFHVWDDIFNLDVKRGIELSRMIAAKKKNMRFLYTGGLRADIMKRELLREMIKAGCCYICYAVESASPRVQKMIKKNLNLKRAAEAINFTSDTGVWVNTYNMLGFPTETYDEMKKTIDYNVGLRHHSIKLFKVIPQEGTELYDITEEKRRSLTGETGTYDDYDQLYTAKVTREQFEGLVKDGWRRFYFDEKRISRILNMKSPWLSARQIKRMQAIDLIHIMMRLGIKDLNQFAGNLKMLIQNVFTGVTLPKV